MQYVEQLHFTSLLYARYQPYNADDFSDEPASNIVYHFEIAT